MMRIAIRVPDFVTVIQRQSLWYLEFNLADVEKVTDWLHDQSSNLVVEFRSHFKLLGYKPGR